MFGKKKPKSKRGIGNAPDRVEPFVDEAAAEEALAAKRVNLDEDMAGKDNTDSQPESSDADVSGAAEDLNDDASELEGADESEGSGNEELDAARAEASEMKDKYVRAHAEMENIRRRSDADIAKARKYGTESLAKAMLDARDSLDLAKSVDLSESGEEALPRMLEGLDLTLRQMDAAFDKHSIKSIDPEPGTKLDPELHQAMGTQPTNEVPANHVALVVQKGYQLHDRLLRPAMVMVAAAAADGEVAENKAESGDESAA